MHYADTMKRCEENGTAQLLHGFVANSDRPSTRQTAILVLWSPYAVGQTMYIFML